MKKPASILLLCLNALIVLNCSAQTYQWAGLFNGSQSFRYFNTRQEYNKRAMAVDQFGNCYYTGSYLNFADFDPGPGTHLLYSSKTLSGWPNSFIVKLSPWGTLAWAKQFGSDTSGTPPVNRVMSRSIEIDRFWNSYIIGEFSGKTDFDPNASSYHFVTPSSNGFHFFILKLDPNGALQWVKTIEGNTQVSASHIDTQGNLYISGRYRGAVDFDPDTSSTQQLTAGGNYDSFILKLNGSGNFVWVKSFYGISIPNRTESKIVSIDLDTAGNIYSAGYYKGRIDFDPSQTQVTQLTNSTNTNYMFISKLDSLGNYVWVKDIRGGGDLNNMVVDPQGNVYYTGRPDSLTDFDPDTGSYNLIISASGTDIFIAKLNNGGRFAWANKINGTGQINARSILVDVNNNLILGGDFNSTANFSFSSVNNLSANGTDAYVSYIDSSCTPIWTKQFRSVNSNSLSLMGSMVLSPNGNLFSSGFHLDSVDYDPSNTVHTQVAPSTAGNWGYSLFIQKMNLNQPVGISQEDKEEAEFLVYPNPTSDLVYVKSPNKITSIVLIDLSGRSYAISYNTNSGLIDLSAIPNGMYLIRMKTTNGIVQKKLIKH